MTDIPVLYSFARSGGTLVNQLIGAHPGCLVLSEVNPCSSFKSIAEQALEWLKLLAPHESAEFSGLPYPQQISTLQGRAEHLGKRLVVRDWATVNFLPNCAGNRIKPSDQLEQKLYLERAGFRTLPLVSARRGTSVFKSIKTNFPHLRDLEIEDFARSYLAYAQAVSGFPVIHMETLRAQPEATLKRILEWLGLDPDSYGMLMENFPTFRTCTGNTTLTTLNESALAQQILPPDAAPADNAECHPVLAEADRLLGYA